MKKIILASKSPRRKELLEKEGYVFDIIPSSFELDINGENYSDDLLKRCVGGKLNDVRNKIMKSINISSIDNALKMQNAAGGNSLYNKNKDINSHDKNVLCNTNKATDLYIISADTVVVLDNIIIGKPKNREDAIKILNGLSGKTHFVATGVEVMHAKYENGDIKIISDSFDISKTYVTFRDLTIEDIEKYIDTKKPYDKAGAYGIQDDDFDFHTKIDGPLDNVIGMPMDIVNKMTR